MSSGCLCFLFLLFFSSRRRHTRSFGDWSSDVCSSDLISLLRWRQSRQRDVPARCRRCGGAGGAGDRDVVAAVRADGPCPHLRARTGLGTVPAAAGLGCDRRLAGCSDLHHGAREHAIFALALARVVENACGHYERTLLKTPGRGNYESQFVSNDTIMCLCNSLISLVPRRGLEPPRVAPLVPETSASTNSATWACGGRRNVRKGS